MNIPLYTVTHSPRMTLTSRIMSIMSEVKATQLFANVEHEVDELRRDIQVCKLAKEAKVTANFVHDKCIITPGVVTSKQGKTYTVC